eukprot:scaffold320_cov367-Pinguiococcus_pyrenoidosus.AAC.8
MPAQRRVAVEAFVAVRARATIRTKAAGTIEARVHAFSRDGPMLDHREVVHQLHGGVVRRVRPHVAAHLQSVDRADSRGVRQTGGVQVVALGPPEDVAEKAIGSAIEQPVVAGVLRGFIHVVREWVMLLSAQVGTPHRLGIGGIHRWQELVVHVLSAVVDELQVCPGRTRVRVRVDAGIDAPEAPVPPRQVVAPHAAAGVQRVEAAAGLEASPVVLGHHLVVLGTSHRVALERPVLSLPPQRRWVGRDIQQEDFCLDADGRTAIISRPTRQLGIAGWIAKVRSPVANAAVPPLGVKLHTLAGIRRDAPPSVVAVLRAHRHAAVSAVPSPLAGAGVRQGAVAVVKTRLGAGWDRAVMPRPPRCAATRVRSDAGAVVVASAKHVIDAASAFLEPPASGIHAVDAPLLPGAVGQVRVLDSHVEELALEVQLLLGCVRTRALQLRDASPSRPRDARGAPVAIDSPALIGVQEGVARGRELEVQPLAFRVRRREPHAKPVRVVVTVELRLPVHVPRVVVRMVEQVVRALPLRDRANGAVVPPLASAVQPQVPQAALDRRRDLQRAIRVVAEEGLEDAELRLRLQPRHVRRLLGHVVALLADRRPAVEADVAGRTSADVRTDAFPAVGAKVSPFSDHEQGHVRHLAVRRGGERRRPSIRRGIIAAPRMVRIPAVGEPGAVPRKRRVRVVRSDVAEAGDRRRRNLHLEALGRFALEPGERAETRQPSGGVRHLPSGEVPPFLEAVEGVGGSAPLLEAAGIDGRPTRRRRSRLAVRVRLLAKACLAAARREMALPRPPIRALARIRGDALAAVETRLRAHRRAAVDAAPVPRTLAGVGADAAASVATGLRAHRRGAVGVEPTWKAVAGVRRHAAPAVGAALNAQRSAAVRAREARDAGARARRRADAASTATSRAGRSRAVDAGPAGRASARVGRHASSAILAHEAADGTHGPHAVIAAVRHHHAHGVGGVEASVDGHASRSAEARLLCRLRVRIAAGLLQQRRRSAGYGLHLHLALVEAAYGEEAVDLARDGGAGDPILRGGGDATLRVQRALESHLHERSHARIRNRACVDGRLADAGEVGVEAGTLHVEWRLQVATGGALHLQRRAVAGVLHARHFVVVDGEVDAGLVQRLRRRRAHAGLDLPAVHLGSQLDVRRAAPVVAVVHVGRHRRGREAGGADGRVVAAAAAGSHDLVQPGGAGDRLREHWRRRQCSHSAADVVDDEGVPIRGGRDALRPVEGALAAVAVLLAFLVAAGEGDDAVEAVDTLDADHHARVGDAAHAVLVGDQQRRFRPGDGHVGGMEELGGVQGAVLVAGDTFHAGRRAALEHGAVRVELGDDQAACEGEGAAVGRQPAHEMVVAVRDEDVAVVVHGQAAGAVEARDGAAAVGKAGLRPGRFEGMAVGEGPVAAAAAEALDHQRGALLAVDAPDAVVPAVRHEDLQSRRVVVQRHATRAGEPRRRGGAVHVALGAADARVGGHLPGGSDPADAVVSRVRHEHVEVFVDGHVFWRVELRGRAGAIRVAWRAAPGQGGGVALRVEGAGPGWRRRRPRELPDVDGSQPLGRRVQGVLIPRKELRILGVRSRPVLAWTRVVAPAPRGAAAVVLAIRSDAVPAGEQHAHVAAAAAAEVVPVGTAHRKGGVAHGRHVAGDGGPVHALELQGGGAAGGGVDVLADVALAPDAAPGAHVAHVLRVPVDAALGLHALPGVLLVAPRPLRVHDAGARGDRGPRARHSHARPLRQQQRQAQQTLPAPRTPPHGRRRCPFKVLLGEP